MRPSDSIVEMLWRELVQLRQELGDSPPGALSALNSAFAKTMTLAAGNWLERRTMRALESFVECAAPKHPSLWEFTKRRAIARQFHTLLDPNRSISAFVAHFGDDIKRRAMNFHKEEEVAREASESLVRLIGGRNDLAHGDKIDFTPQWTPEEVRNLFHASADWLTWFESLLLSKEEVPGWKPSAPALENRSPTVPPAE